MRAIGVQTASRIRGLFVLDEKFLCTYRTSLRRAGLEGEDLGGGVLTNGDDVGGRVGGDVAR